MKNICDRDRCTGCMACINTCNQNAIICVEDSEGFLYPYIREESCIRCGKCYSVCPHNKAVEREFLNKTKCLAGWNRNQKQRKISSSGGVFAAISDYIIQSGGVVFGAAFSKDYSVNHIMIDTIQGLPLLQGSKYVQSQINDTYRQCSRMLATGRKVLFTGTPCQIDGLYAFLGDRSKDYLYTIDILCHGVPSYKTIRSYLDSIESTYKSKINKFSFRNKKTIRGWEHSCTLEITLDDGRKITGYKEDIYFWEGFLRNIFLRKCCYKCEYAGKERVGDITIGDFWGIQNVAKDEKINGVSFILCNSEKGNELLKRVNIATESRLIKEAIPQNRTLEKPFTQGPGREEFFRDMGTYGFRRAVENNNPERMKKLKVRAGLQSILGDDIYQTMKKILHRR